MRRSNFGRHDDDEMRRRVERLHAGGMWTWVFDSLDRAVTRGDQQRQMMARMLMQGGLGIEGDFDHGLEVLNKGKALAERLGEAWWIVLFDHWRLQLMLKKGDYPLGRELVMHLVTEVRKPRYEGLPMRVCIQDDLIRVCNETDPVGYASRIEQAFRTMATTVDPNTICYRCMQGLHVDFAKALGRWDEVERRVRELLRQDADDPRSLVIHYTNMCRIAHERGDPMELAEWAYLGEGMARTIAHDVSLAEFLAWEAVITTGGDAEKAARLAREAREVMDREPGIPHGDFYDALCVYYEAAGALGQALDTRFTQLAQLANKGRLKIELQCRAEICRLLMAQGKSAKNQIAAARKVAHDLIDPAPALAIFDRLDREGPAQSARI